MINASSKNFALSQFNKISLGIFLSCLLLNVMLPIEQTIGFSAYRFSLAGLLFLSFIFFFFVIRQQHLTLHHQQEIILNAQKTDQINDQETIYVIYASQTGYAEQIALQTTHSLQAVGRQAVLINLAQCSQELLSNANHILFVVSTTGEGDAPDSAAQFMQQILVPNKSLNLCHLHFGILALGDKHYQHFCAFGHQLEQYLMHQKAQILFDLVEVDNGDQAALRHWQTRLSVLTGHTKMADWVAPEYYTWILKERRILNEGSAGNAIFHLCLQSQQSNITWQAGDILEVLPETKPRSIHQQMNEPSHTTTLPHREYSIASIASDGQIELIVRQAYQFNGDLGIGSGWLTEYAKLGGHIQCRIRSNSNFHAHDNDRPMIFIGNGTGIAGLRAHIKQRITKGHYQNWLIFGERNQAHDYLFQDDIHTWQQSGYIQRVDLAFSRDQEQRVYVQDQLRNQARELLNWFNKGAAIYVCGSLEGMASGVDDALKEILGTSTYEQLRVNQLYRRDVY
jgi:sulfite reductase (NADPH) flavoprotein alpha-component